MNAVVVPLVVRRALQLIENGALDAGNVSRLAEALGIGPRHLRRLFLEHVGASPSAVARTRRLQLAKQLLDDTDLSITEVALESGFGSVRRFNAAFRDAYNRTPTELRRRCRTANHAAMRKRNPSNVAHAQK
jgi:transcriptional regulator GlxA family with amidase domain